MAGQMDLAFFIVHSVYHVPVAPFRLFKGQTNRREVHLPICQERAARHLSYLH
jgi:hypothetical protein